MAYPDVVERHAEEAAGLWLRRQNAAIAPHYRLRDLAEIDDRVEANLDGIRLAGREGGRAVAGLDTADSGVWYVRATLALEQQSSLELAKLLDQLPRRPELEGELIGALRWVPLERSAWATRALLDASCPAPLRRFGISAYIAHRRDPGKPLIDALAAGSAELRAAALEGIGWLGKSDLLPELRGELDSPNESVRWAAAIGAALLGDEGDYQPLWDHADPDTARGRQSLVLAVERTPAEAARARIDSWLAAGSRRRAAIAGSGLSGDAARVPFLLDAMRDPELARSAGEAFHRITGLVIAGELRGEPPKDFNAGPNDDPDDDDVALDPELPLPWPRLEAVERAFMAWRLTAPNATRLWFGRPLDLALCDEALRHGSQRLRGDAALVRAAWKPGEMVADTLAPGFRQLRRG